MPGDGSDRRPAPDREESFLRRWSRRKQAGDAPDAAASPPAEQEERPTPAQTTDPDPAASPADAGDTARPADEDLPHPDTLDRDSDFSAYLSDRVSAHLRRAAMRRLFSMPEFNVRDGLDDYDEDYTQFKSLGDTVTAHMRYHRERLSRREEEEAAARPADTEAPGDDRSGTGDDATPDDEHDTDHRDADDARRAQARDDDDDT